MSCEPPNDPILYAVGDTYPLHFGITDAYSGLAYNLTGITAAWFIVKAALADPDASAVISRTLGSGVTVIDATGSTTAGAQSILAAAPTLAQSQALVAGTSYFAFLRIKTAANEILTVFAGLRFVATQANPLGLS